MSDTSNSKESSSASTSESSAASVNSSKSEPLASASSTPTKGPTLSPQEPEEPAIKSSIGGAKGKEPAGAYDEIINKLQDAISKTNESIGKKKEANGKIEVSGIADAYKLAQYQPTFLDEYANSKREERMAILKDPNASLADKESAKFWSEVDLNAWGMIKDKVSEGWDKFKGAAKGAFDKFFSKNDNASANKKDDEIELEKNKTDMSHAEGAKSPLLGASQESKEVESKLGAEKDADNDVEKGASQKLRA
jgi:acetyl/propionyl-CoA carboxylase alpha subunit